MSDPKGFEPKYDDQKNNEVMYFGKAYKKDDGSSYRKVELFIDEDVSYLSEKNKEMDSKPVDFSIKDSVTLYESPSGQQKIHCWLMEESSTKYPSALHISRRTSKGVYGSQEVTLTLGAIIGLFTFLQNLAIVDSPEPTQIPIRELKTDKDTSSSLILSNDEFMQLIKSNIKSTEDFYKLLSLQKMQLAVNRLEEIVEGNYKNETEIQHFLKDNIWMFGNSYVSIVENGKVNASNILDLVPRNFESYIDIIEVKLPKEKLFNFDRSHSNYYVTAGLTKAIAQTQNYIFELEKKTVDHQFKSINNCKIIRPKGVVLYGSEKPLTADEQQYLRILNSSYHNLQVITYQQLLEKAKNTLQIWECHEPPVSG